MNATDEDIAAVRAALDRLPLPKRWAYVAWLDGTCVRVKLTETVGGRVRRRVGAVVERVAIENGDLPTFADSVERYIR